MTITTQHDFQTNKVKLTWNEKTLGGDILWSPSCRWYRIEKGTGTPQLRGVRDPPALL